MLAKTKKIGSSIAVKIPRELVEQEGIKEGEMVELEIHKAKKDWFGAFPELKPFSRTEELDASIK